MAKGYSIPPATKAWDNIKQTQEELSKYRLFRHNPELAPPIADKLWVLPSDIYKHGGTRLRHYAIKRSLSSTIPPVWAEFGVARGVSAGFFKVYLPAYGTFYLFDSFEGFPKDWVISDDLTREKEAWACDAPTFDDERIKVIPGFFSDTLPMQDERPLSFIHIDCDLYESTKTVFEGCDHQIVPGTIILFDELWGYPKWRDGEYKALMEWDREWQFLGSDTGGRAAIEVLS